MKSKIAAILKSCKKPVLLFALVLGAWMTATTKAHAQLPPQFENPGPNGSTNIITNCDGYVEFFGTDQYSSSTNIDLYINGIYIASTWVADYSEQPWYFYPEPVEYNGMEPADLNTCTVDDGVLLPESVYVWWCPDASCDDD